jgi:hypothetical protein
MILILSGTLFKYSEKVEARQKTKEYLQAPGQ